MIKRQSLRSSLLSLIRPHQHSLGDCYSLMAAASSVFQGRNDPLLLTLSSPSKRLHALHSHRRRGHHHHQYHASPNLIERLPFPSLEKVVPPVDSTGEVMFGLNGRCISGLSLKGCSNSRDDLRKWIGNNNSSTDQHHHHNHIAFQNARSFACSLPQLVRDSEIGLGDDRDAVARLTNDPSGAYHHGSPLGFPDQPFLEKIVVAVDVDEVLGNFVSALNRFIADRYSLNHCVSEYHVYEFFKIWNCSRDEADVRVHEFFKTSYFKTGIHPIPGAQQALQNLSRFCNLSVVTSRQNAIRDHTIDWIEKHYPGLFQQIHFGNHFALEGQSRPKSDICRLLGAKFLIDDNPGYAIECAEAGIRVLLFDYENSYPWCKIESVNQHPLVTKVHSWEEVEHQLVSWIVS